ncbi:hypothetical protein DMN91_009359 [Ooceraea biroi]|uniref:Mutator-like transposase domain-containing protein n=1 Tax=Ooceraea biroi TaxID=2015173 RepID=A0A3L8DFA0_OOCBI|nr:uncharacterized protein LOC105278907 [Ooceraea biroi]RLU19001.1 hypothetical protein DMN91_009359 [Ooceraea biroi]
MEVTAITEMFTASQEKYGVKYGNYIGDGDSKTFKAVVDLNPYGDDFPITKSECIGHIEKRMGSRLRNVKKTKKLGGKGKFTDILIKKLTKYYGLAIRRNVESVENMKKDIMATYLHMISTNKNLRHENCPKGEDTWCKYNLAQTFGAKYNHPAPLHAEVAANILPICEDLSREELLERCLGGHTQNANESYNSTVWQLAPKHLHAGRKIVEIAAFIAVCVFNEGFFGVLKIMETLEIKIGTTCKMFADSVDANRIRRQERRSLTSTKEVRLARKQELIEQNEMFEEAEGLLYGPGIAD